MPQSATCVVVSRVVIQISTCVDLTLVVMFPNSQLLTNPNPCPLSIVLSCRYQPMSAWPMS